MRTAQYLFNKTLVSMVALCCDCYGDKKKHKALNTIPNPGGVLDIFLGGEVWRGPSYPDPV